MKAQNQFLSIVALLVFSAAVNSQPAGGLFGYWANLNPSENSDHTNVTIPFTAIADEAVATTVILQELAQADAQGVQAILFVTPFLFDSEVDSDGNMKQNSPHTLDPNALAKFDSLIEALKTNGFLVPNNPSASTVLAFGIIDEPELHGLKDQGGSPHPDLASAISVIRSHSDSSSFPTYLNVHDDFSSVLQGMKLVDWVSMTNYPKSTGDYIASFIGMKNQLLSTQKVILLPQASYGGIMSPFGSWHDPEKIMDWFIMDERTIGIIPFLWSHANAVGTRDIPSLRTLYTNFGGQIKAGNVIRVNVYCDLVGYGWEDFECTAEVNGGTPPYTFEWDNGAQGPVADYHVRCPHPQLGQYHSEVASLTVTDAAGFFKDGSDKMIFP